MPSGEPRSALDRRIVAWVGMSYLAFSVGLWWHVWSTHPSSVMTCGCTDAGREVWYLEWATFSLTHGHDPFYSQWMLFPHGINVLADTSVLLIGFLMTPVTVLFGPVVSMNVVSTLEPALAALSMFWLLGRWVRWGPSAFIGGLCYGFSSFMLVQLAFGWINIATLALLPLMVGCLDDLLVRQTRHPRRVGVILGLLIAAQFFVSIEILLLAAIVALIAILMLLAYVCVTCRAEVPIRVSAGLPGIATAGLVATALLGGPVAFFAFGPAHLGLVVWSGTHAGLLGNAAANFWSTTTTWGPLSAVELEGELHRIGGYQGPALPSMAYLGLGLTVVLALGLVIWRRDRRLWFWGVLGATVGVLSLGVSDNAWNPWRLVDHFDVLQNVWQSRFSIFVDLCAAVMLALIVDHVWLTGRKYLTSGASEHSRWWASLTAVAVAAIALGPIAWASGPNIPLTVQSTSVPTWFVQVAPQTQSPTSALDLSIGELQLTNSFVLAGSRPFVVPYGRGRRSGRHRTSLR